MTNLHNRVEYYNPDPTLLRKLRLRIAIRHGVIVLEYTDTQGVRS